MSQENVEPVRRLHELFNRRDVAGFLGLVHPEFEWVPLWGRLEGTVYRGRDEVGQFRDLGDVVLAFGSWDGQARASQVVVQYQPAAWVTRLRDGQASRMETFSNRDHALEAVGLSE